MGYLTTITFRNDEYHELGKDPDALVRKIRDAMNGQKVNDNMMISHVPVHSHDVAVYVVAGNTSVYITGFKESENLMKNHKSFFGDIYKALGSLFKELTERWSIAKKE